MRWREGRSTRGSISYSYIRVGRYRVEVHSLRHGFQVYVKRPGDVRPKKYSYPASTEARAKQLAVRWLRAAQKRDITGREER